MTERIIKYQKTEERKICDKRGGRKEEEEEKKRTKYEYDLLLLHCCFTSTVNI